MREKNSDRLVHVYYVRINERKDLSGTDASSIAERLLSYALMHLYGLTLEECGKKTKEHGKPYFGQHPEVEFNISHSGVYVILTIGGVPLGIDIQEQRVTDIDKLGKKIFSVGEYRDFLTHEDRQEAFFRMWVMKESYIKWTGEGLLHGLKDLKMDGWHRFLHIDKEYFCAVWAGVPLDIRLEEVPLRLIK